MIGLKALEVSKWDLIFFNVSVTSVGFLWCVASCWCDSRYDIMAIALRIVVIGNISSQ
jgi:hypothetical protein